MRYCKKVIGSEGKQPAHDNRNGTKIKPSDLSHLSAMELLSLFLKDTTINVDLRLAVARAIAAYERNQAVDTLLSVTIAAERIEDMEFGIECVRILGDTGIIDAINSLSKFLDKLLHKCERGLTETNEIDTMRWIIEVILALKKIGKINEDWSLLSDAKKPLSKCKQIKPSNTCLPDDIRRESTVILKMIRRDSTRENLMARAKALMYTKWPWASCPHCNRRFNVGIDDFNYHFIQLEKGIYRHSECGKVVVAEGWKEYHPKEPLKKKKTEAEPEPAEPEPNL